MFYKKTAIPVLCLSLCLCGGIVPKAAALEVVEPVRQGEITPYATYIRSKTCVLSISAGTATVQSSVGRQSGVTDHCKVVAYLQENLVVPGKLFQPGRTNQTDFGHRCRRASQ